MTELATDRPRTAAPSPRSATALRAKPAGHAIAFVVLLMMVTACTAQEAPTVDPLSLSSKPLSAYVHFGAFTYGGVWQGMEPVARLESHLGRRLDVVHWS